MEQEDIPKKIQKDTFTKNSLNNCFVEGSPKEKTKKRRLVEVDEELDTVMKPASKKSKSSKPKELSWLSDM